VLCANETRATSIPAATSASRVSELAEAGPIVATILVRRLSWRCGREWARTSSKNERETRRVSTADRDVLGGFTTSACPIWRRRSCASPARLSDRSRMGPRQQVSVLEDWRIDTVQTAPSDKSGKIRS